MVIGNVVGAIIALIVGGTVAAVSLVGVVTHSVNSPSDRPGTVTSGVPYGTTQ